MDTLIEQLQVYRAAVLKVPTIEKVNTPALIEQIATTGNWQISTWHLLGDPQQDNILPACLTAFANAITQRQSPKLFVFENIPSLLQQMQGNDGELLTQGIIDLVLNFHHSQAAVLFIDDGGASLPQSLQTLIPHHDLPLPTHPEIQSILAEFGIDSPRLTTVAAGLMGEEIRLGLRLALLRTTDPQEIEQRLLTYKVECLQKIGLEFLAEPDVPDFGGLDRLKVALSQVKRDFTPQARQFGIPLPRGWLFVGPPGTGKTHSAKCAAKQLGLPLISVGIDAIKAGGADVLKALLHRIEAAAPAVIYIDELDKCFSKDSDPQVLGVLLTWLQEKRSSTFVIATLNELNNVPSAVTRQGRFDRIFWVGFPQENERYEIIKLYASRFDPRYLEGYGGLDFEQWSILLTHTLNFTGAELKFLVDQAARGKFYQTSEQDESNFLPLDYQDLMAARSTVVPLYERKTAEILEITKQAKKFSEPSSSPDRSEFKLPTVNVFGN
jgi:ATP-dependent 26S proteasome regulatory subunit